MAKFIKVTSEGGNPAIINVEKITHIEPYRDGSYVYLDGGKNIQTNLSPDEVMRLAQAD
jgi:hypothetical protein